jgi:hypothetical protein
VSTNPTKPTYVLGSVRTRPERSTGVRVDKVGVTKSLDAAPISVPFAVAAAGNNTIVAASTGNKIRVLSYWLQATGGAVNVRWESGTASTFLVGGTGAGGRVVLVAQQIIQEQDPYILFETTAGELLNLNTSGAVAVNGRVTYVLVPA